MAATTGTTEEVALLVGVAPLTVTAWVKRGYLTPLSENRKPSRFRISDVLECAVRRMPKKEHRRLDALWESVLASEGDELP